MPTLTEVENKPRRLTLTAKAYLKQLNKAEIRKDNEVQRLADQWDKEMRAELVRTVLNNDFIPEITLGEVVVNDGIKDPYILDGLQRSTVLEAFRYGNEKITKDITIGYKVIVLDDDGERTVEIREFNLKNKTFNDLPEELKDRFDNYNLEFRVCENLTMEQANEYVRRLNYGKGMTTNQKALTYMGNVAPLIRDIINGTHFFEDCGNYSAGTLKTGAVERLVTETYMTVFAVEEWKANAIKIGKYVDENATTKQFDELKELFNDLYDVADGKHGEFFNVKNTSVFVASYAKAKQLGLSATQYDEFLTELEGDLGDFEIDGVSWNNTNVKRNTKDKKTIKDKLALLEALIKAHFEISGQ